MGLSSYSKNIFQFSYDTHIYLRFICHSESLHFPEGPNGILPYKFMAHQITAVIIGLIIMQPPFLNMVHRISEFISRKKN